MNLSSNQPILSFLLSENNVRSYLKIDNNFYFPAVCNAEPWDKVF